MATASLTQERLMSLALYNAETGVIAWRHNGRRAGWRHRLGYRNVRVDGVTYAEHRLAWFYVHGWWPAADLDHINRVRDDNRLANLRPATRSENCQNQPIRSTNRSGVTGVYYHSCARKWVASINIDKKQRHLGVFNTAEQAAAARKSAEQQYYAYRPA